MTRPALRTIAATFAAVLLIGGTADAAAAKPEATQTVKTTKVTRKAPAKATVQTPHKTTAKTPPRTTGKPSAKSTGKPTAKS